MKKMDPERTILIVALGFAVAVGCFVIWGPSTFRPKKRKDQVVGLVNLGFTCFLNTLLQALASCPVFIEWLSQLEDDGECSLTATLRTVLLVLNGGFKSTVNDPYAPSEVIAALKRHRWVISPGEQDAHELFHVLLETLEEEVTTISPKNGCLSDALLLERCGQGDDHAVHKSLLKPRASSTDIKSDDDPRNASTRSRLIPIRRIQDQNGDNMCAQTLSLDHLPRHQLPASLPFRGMLTSQLKCTECGFKSALKFDKFDTLSLPLPTKKMGFQQLTLQMLLDNFVSTEVIKDVTCSNCSRGQSKPVQTTALKTLNFGKLPKCLCLHIVRTMWNQDGVPCKRDEYVDFPEFLVMDNYTHSQVQRNSRRMVCEQQHLSDEIRQNGDLQNHTESNQVKTKSNLKNGSPSPPTINHSSNEISTHSSKHMYRLKAVVVHTGDIHSGHFVTYRKGPVKSLLRHRPECLESNIGGRVGQLESRESTRWYYTSDTVVRPATLCEALLTNAYMLFYEKCFLPA